MNAFPLFADLTGRRALLVGGGPVAERKAALLLDAGAALAVVAPAVGAGLSLLAQRRRLEIIETPFHEKHLDGAWLVVAATDDHALNRRIAALCERRRLFVNVVDDARLSTVQVPAIVDRSPVTIAISSGGQAPMIARRLRECIEQACEHALGPLAALAGRYRQAIRRHRPDMRHRRDFYDWMLDGPVAAAIRSNQLEHAEQLLERRLQQRPKPGRPGLAILVGAGPGDPGLLTLAGLRALNRADVILYDRLVSPEVMNLARRDAIRTSVGKIPGQNHHATQKRIHDLLLHHARAGRCVVRLKGGDPLVFGRGGEELEFLRAHGIDYEVVPGVTAAVACAAYSGVPLTHREHAQAVRFVTVQRQDGRDTTDWPALARDRHTLAFYMGASRLQHLASRLIAHGRAPDTPFALIENGTRANQRVLTGSLGQLPDLAKRHAIEAPSLLLLGGVAALSPSLHWFGAHIAAAESPRAAASPAAQPA